MGGLNLTEFHSRHILIKESAVLGPTEAKNKLLDIRNRIVNGEDFQIVFSDTPGIIKPAYKLQESMMDFVKSAFDDADVLDRHVEQRRHHATDVERHLG